jgi:photosystem II stability/assembly factor-like uncharacterized protein
LRGHFFSASHPSGAIAQPALDSVPAITAIDPNAFAGGINTPVTINGANLEAVVSVKLGTTPLIILEISDAEHILAQVPWDIQPGTYDLIVKDASDQTASLPAAVTISPAATGWASNGPFGGTMINLSLDPLNTDRLYAGARFSGFYKTTNGAQSWNLEMAMPMSVAFIDKVHFIYPAGQTFPNLFLPGADGHSGHFRSIDNGATWQPSNPAGFNSWPAMLINSYVAVDNADPDRVYLGYFSGINTASPHLGLYISHDRGDSWTQSTATAGLQISAVAVEPGDPDHVVIGTRDARFLSSTDGGATWSAPLTIGDADHNFTNIDRLLISPTVYEGHRKIWAIRLNQGSNWVYSSSDDGATWTPLKIDSSNNHDIQYHDSIPGLLWAATGGGFYSSDDGANWTALNAPIGAINQFALAAGAGTREGTTLYAGTNSGVYASADGGSTWVEKDQGLGAAIPDVLVASPFNADEAFAAVPSKGMMRTLDGGRNWQLLAIPNVQNNRPAITADPFTPGKFYFASSSQPTVYITTDHGSSYTEKALTPPAEFNSWSAYINAVAAHPQNGDHLLAGMCSEISNTAAGAIYASADGGESWAQQTTPPNTKCILTLVYAPAAPGLVFAGTEGGGLLVSVDGGSTWTVPAYQPNVESINQIAVDPRNSQSIYLYGRPKFNGGSGDVGLFATHDGGATWEKIAGINSPGLTWYLKIVPVGVQYWLYAATLSGLTFLRDIPATGFDPLTTWEYSSGIAGAANANAFAAVAEDARVVYYIGTPGGAAARLANSNPLSPAAPTTLLAGGIYRRQGAESIPPTRAKIPHWQMKNMPGFGNAYNAVGALEVFNGQLYAATSNWGDAGCRIWRSTGGSNWAPASEYGMGAAYATTNPAILDLTTFKGQLYASVGWGANEGQVWRSSNGTTWEKVSSTEWGGATNQAVTVLAVFDNELYAFSEAAGLQVWHSSTGDSGTWLQEAQGGFGDANNGSVSGAVEFNSKFYLASSNSVDGATVWSKSAGGSWTQSNTSGFGSSQNQNTGGLAVLGGYLYVGTENTTTGGQIWRTDGTSWTQVMGNGFADLNNTLIAGLMTVDNQLFVVAKNLITGLQVWASVDGTYWAPLDQTGMGNPDNSNLLWSNSVAAYNNTFYFGTYNDSSGGEIWQYTGFPVYLPLVRR